MEDDHDDGFPPNGGGRSTVIAGESRGSTIYMDEIGYEYHMNWEVHGTRYLRCARRHAGCRVTAWMRLVPGAPIVLGNRQHIHHPHGRHSVEVRTFLNTLRERGGSENTTPAQIYNETAPQNVRAALAVGRPAAVRTIAWARRRLSPPIPESLEGWVAILLAQEWQQRLLWCNGTNNRFYQGRLDVLREGVSRFVGLVFANVAHLMSINIHLATVRTMCVDGTFQVRPTHPPDIVQLITIQIVINNVAVPIIHGLLIESTTEAYCRLLQFVRNDLQLNFDYQNLQIITDFEQGLRNAIMMVMPESSNTGCWFHYIRCIIRFIRTNRLTGLCNTDANARRVIRMLMALPHLPADVVEHHGIEFSIPLGFRNIQNLVKQYGLEQGLSQLMAYFTHYWLEVVGPHRFSVYRLRHRTNNFIESYHASLLRRMGQHPALYVFYDHLRGIEEQSRIDFTRALDGLQVRRTASNIYGRNMGVLLDAWQRVHNGNYNLLEFQRYTAHTSEQILINEIGEPIFEDGNVQDIVVNLQPRPLPPFPAGVEQAPPIIPRARGRGRGRARGGIPDGRGRGRGRGRGQAIIDVWNRFFEEIDNEENEVQDEPAVDEVEQINLDENLHVIVVDVCPICYDREVSVTMMPCRHQYCNVCVLRLIQEDIIRCPVCRGHPTNYIGLVL